MNNKIILRRTKKRDLKDIQNLFFKTFYRKISLKFYKNRYFNKSKFSSFIAIYNQQIIGHVGFVEYKYGFNKKQIFSRHSSIVLKDFREKGIYKKLCLYSYRQLLKNGNDKIITWPNKTNRKYQPHYKNYICKEKFLLFKKFNKKNSLKLITNFFKIKKISLLTKNEWNEVKNYNIKQNNLILKNKSYFKFLFKNVSNTKYYFIKFQENSKNSYLFFSERLLSEKKTYTIDILNFFGENEIFIKIINMLQNFYLYKKEQFLMQVFISSLHKKTIFLLKKYGFVLDKNIFKIVILSKNKVSNNERNYIIKSTIHMSDTDVFINTN